MQFTGRIVGTHTLFVMRIIAAVIALSFFGCSVSADEYSFVTLQLPAGIRIDAPRNWRALNDEQNQLIALARDAALDLSGVGVKYTGNVLFAANSNPPTTYASMRITIDPEMAPSSEDIAQLRTMNDSALAELAPQFAALMDQTLSPAGLQFMTSLGLYKEDYGGYVALSYRYRRSGAGGPVIVDLIQVFRPGAMVRVNLAYRESEAPIWKVVIARIKKSIALE